MDSGLNKIKISVIDANEKLALMTILDSLEIVYTVKKDNFEMKIGNEQYEKLQAAILRHKFKTGVVRFANAGVNTLIGGTEYLAKDIAVPIAKLGLKVGAGAVRIGTESAVVAGSAIVNTVAEQGGAAVNNIKASREYLEAKKNIGNGLVKLKNLIGFTGGSSITVTKL